MRMHTSCNNNNKAKTSDERERQKKSLKVKKVNGLHAKSVYEYKKYSTSEKDCAF